MKTSSAGPAQQQAIAAATIVTAASNFGPLTDPVARQASAGFNIHLRPILSQSAGQTDVLSANDVRLTNQVLSNGLGHLPPYSAITLHHNTDQAGNRSVYNGEIGSEHFDALENVVALAVYRMQFDMVMNESTRLQALTDAQVQRIIDLTVWYQTLLPGNTALQALSALTPEQYNQLQAAEALRPLVLAEIQTGCLNLMSLQPVLTAPTPSPRAGAGPVMAVYVAASATAGANVAKSVTGQAALNDAGANAQYIPNEVLAAEEGQPRLIKRRDLANLRRLFAGTALETTVETAELSGVDADTAILDGSAAGVFPILEIGFGVADFAQSAAGNGD